MELILEEKEEEIKKKQNLINILSKENQNIKKSLDIYYELDVNKNISNELKEKGEKKKNIDQKKVQKIFLFLIGKTQMIQQKI